MSCVTGASPTYETRTLSMPGTSGAIQVFTEESLDTYPRLLIEQLGMTCESAKEFIYANFYLGIISNVGIQVLKAGGVLPALTGSMVNPTGPSVAGLIAADSVTLGTWSLNEEGFTNPVGAATAGSTFNDNFVIQSFEAQLIIPGVTQVLASFDFDKWFCCATAGLGCPGCSGGGSNKYAPSFLIPRPENPAPGEENSSVPPLETALLLSNYTFQFPDNFGVKNK